MSRTRHALPTRCCTRPACQNRRKGEKSVIDSLKESDVLMSNIRHINRLMGFMSIIPEPWDDKTPSAWSEYHNKTHCFN